MILLWDSSQMLCRFAVVLEDDSVHEYEWEAGRTLARDMLSRLRDVFAEYGRTFSDLTGIGVMVGPGSFTGLRIGITVLNTIVADRRIPIVGTNGDAWQEQALDRLKRGETDSVVMPDYGGEAHITQPRK